MDSYTHPRFERTLFVTPIEAFGRSGPEEMFRPANDLAEKFADLLGQKTLTRNDIAKIRSLGYEIKLKEVTL